MAFSGHTHLLFGQRTLPWRVALVTHTHTHNHARTHESTHIRLREIMPSWDHHHLNNLGRPHIPILHNKSQGHWPSGSGEEYF